ncbi:MAG: DUF47 domain-containing protein [Aeromicrobium sp.]
MSGFGGCFSSAPRYQAFYGLFRQAGDNLGCATELLQRLMRNWPDGSAGLRREILDREHEGDRITHDLIHHLQVRAFTPFDSRDVHKLASQLDDIVDLAEEVADFMGLYSVEAPTDQGVELAGILHCASREVAAAMRTLHDPPALRRHAVAIDRLEDEGDRVEREALASLFQGGIDPMVVIRWKDLYERLEAAIDACDHVANTLNGLVVRHI